MQESFWLCISSPPSSPQRSLQTTSILRAGGCTNLKPQEDAALSTRVFVSLRYLHLRASPCYQISHFPMESGLLQTMPACCCYVGPVGICLRCKRKKLYLNSESHPLTGNLHFYLEDFFKKDFSNESSAPEFLWKLICLVCMHNFIKSDLRKMSN